MQRDKDRAAPDRLGRTLTADPVDQAWCGDVTFIRTVPDPMDPATVIDPYSRRCLGHATSAQHDQELRVVSLRRGPVELAEYVGSDHVKASRRLGRSAWCSRWVGSPRRWTTPWPRRSTSP